MPKLDPESRSHDTSTKEGAQNICLTKQGSCSMYYLPDECRDAFQTAWKVSYRGPFLEQATNCQLPQRLKYILLLGQLDHNSLGWKKTEPIFHKKIHEFPLYTSSPVFLGGSSYPLIFGVAPPEPNSTSTVSTWKQCNGNEAESQGIFHLCHPLERCLLVVFSLVVVGGGPWKQQV